MHIFVYQLSNLISSNSIWIDRSNDRTRAWRCSRTSNRLWFFFSSFLREAISPRWSRQWFRWYRLRSILHLRFFVFHLVDFRLLVILLLFVDVVLLGDHVILLRYYIGLSFSISFRRWHSYGFLLSNFQFHFLLVIFQSS